MRGYLTVFAALLLAAAQPTGVSAAETAGAPAASKPDAAAPQDPKAAPAAAIVPDVSETGITVAPEDEKVDTPETGKADTPKTGKAVKKPKVAASHAPGGLPSAKPLGKFDNWEAAFFDDHGNKVCYMAAAPVSTHSSAPVKGRDKNVMLFITHWPADNEKNAVTISAGYSYKEGSKAIVSIGTESYAMETGGKGTGADADMSWMKDDSQDDALTTAIQKGAELTVKGASKRGTVITDTYSLKGSADAYKAISKACGY